MAYLFAILAGTFAVLQTGLNKNISQQWGFGSAVLLNGLMFLAFSILIYALMRWQPNWFPESFLPQGAFGAMKWHWIFPGIFGFILVMGITVATHEIGAVQAFLLAIAAQVIVSMGWDYFVDGKPLTTMKIAGAVVTFIGVLMTTK